MDHSKEDFLQICLADERCQIAVVMELCRKFLRQHPRHGPGWLQYGMAQACLAHYAAAEKAIRKAIKLCPDKSLPIAYSQMGHLLKAQGYFQQAAGWYGKALKARPDDAAYHIFAGSNAFQWGRLKQAEAHYRNALLCPSGCRDEAYFNLGGILLGRRKYAESIECYREALKIDPKYKIAKERLEDVELALLMLNS
jgi:protein O-GlcNAc transferase